MSQILKIAIAESSTIIRSGVVTVLKRISGFQIQPFEIIVADTIEKYIRAHKPEVLILNPVFWGMIDVEQLRKNTEHPHLRCIALVVSQIDAAILSTYDERIGLYDSVELIQEKFDNLFNENTLKKDGIGDGMLSSREKEVLICVVKGMTNREIAEKLFLSTHTVISHRKNITRKLEIHSVAGLTVYAIVKNFVSLDEIEKSK
ncbi:MAG: response regulator transcription factor [Prevotellaceae bacterium]|jgi:DNA-binding NarL/FixJ family response regulator|nr:response regulator transcription factor [Prevotellaceae bacterium]